MITYENESKRAKLSISATYWLVDSINELEKMDTGIALQQITKLQDLFKMKWKEENAK